LSVSRDITPRLEAEEALRSTRAYLENLLDYANAPVIVWDASGKITRFNHAFERLTGYAAKEVIGRELEILFPANTKEISLDRIRKTLTGEFWESVEIQILRNDGSIRTALWNSANVYAEDGKTLVATIAQGQDITERKQAEEKLRETRDYLENLIDYANAPIIVWDSAFKIARFNNAFERLTGYEAGDVVGKELQILFPEESREESLRRIEGTLAEDHWESVEIPIRRKDGATRLVLWNSANVHAGNGSRLVGTIAQGQDITERKRYEDACKQANKKLRLLGGITRHDLLNQVGILKGWLEIARGSKEGASTEAYLDSAMEAADVIQAHLEFASDYEKIGMARKKWLSVEEVFRAGARGLDLSRISLILDLDGLEVFADSMLEKVFRNLIDNSWRHGVRVTKIHVHHEETEDGQRLIVEDDGAGVPKDEKDLIFERRIGKNKGHGLFLVKEILAIAGMTIKETGEAERGARFEILIPKRTYRFRLLR
jgi:PAS domain S-box-containing protein